MKIDKYITSLIIISMLAIGAFTVQSEWSNKYAGYRRENTDLTVEQEGKILAITELNTIGGNIQSKLLSLSTKVSKLDLSSIYDLGGLFLDVGAYLMKLPNVALQTTETMFDILKIPVPAWFALGMGSLITFLMISKLVAIYLKREEL